MQAGSLLSEPTREAQEYWSGLAYPFLEGIFPTQELKLGSPALQADSLPAELPGKPLKHNSGSIFKYSQNNLTQSKLSQGMLSFNF